ncbi:MAG: sensor histidine kinase [Parafilimonas sp.]|nr:sensor histidine kinase [Parafilimonas sp.]
MRSEINALEKERARIANDLHDDLGASLSAIKLKLQCLNLPDEKEHSLIVDSEAYIDEAMLKLKRISFNLMPRVLQRKGLKQALCELIDTIEQSMHIKISFRYNCHQLNDEQTIHIYRIAQEILNNIVKHSCASVASVELKERKNKLVLNIKDNGTGFKKDDAVKAGMGQGLQNIQARADVLSARMFLSTSIGGGTDYSFQIPLLYDTKI